MSEVALDRPLPARLSSRARKTCVTALRVAPWLVFGPITGFMCERAFRCWRAGEPFLATLYVMLNIEVLIAIPTLTAVIAHYGLGRTS